MPPINNEVAMGRRTKGAEMLMTHSADWRRPAPRRAVHQRAGLQAI